ncbi:hypothetical protein GLOTRDRAFT_137264, partial [Gloeophyllum trabeum ATCC 11539]
MNVMNQLRCFLTGIRDYVFPKIPLQRLRVGEDGSIECFGGGRKHWVLRSDSDVYTVRYKYFVKHPNVRGGRFSVTAPPSHYHLVQTETLSVISGVLGYMLDGVVRTAGPGETVTFKPFHTHGFWAEDSSGEDLLFDLT